MVQRKAEAAARFRLLDHARKALMLQGRKCDALGRILVRHAEMRKDALHLESRQLQHAQDLVQALVEVRLAARKAKASHAGVKLEMHRHLPAQGKRAVGEFLRDVVALHRLRHFELQNALRLIRRREAQH